MMATIESCVECTKQMGPNNDQALNGCALGMDTAKLINSVTQFGTATPPVAKPVTK